MTSSARQQPWSLTQAGLRARPQMVPFTEHVLASIANDEADLSKHAGTQIDASQGFYHASSAGAAHELTGVCIAHDRGGRTIAVKVKDCSGHEESLRRGLAEFRLLRLSIHPHVVKCLDAFVSSTQHLYLLTSWAYFGDLSTTIARAKIGERAIVESDVDKIAFEMLSAIAYVQACGYVHGNVKPRSVLLAKTDQAPGYTTQLTNFDTARHARDTEPLQRSADARRRIRLQRFDTH